jgi:hypothetical protein
MPQLAQRSASTTASLKPGRLGCGACDRGVGAVGQAAVAAGAVGRVDDRDRLWLG